MQWTLHLVTPLVLVLTPILSWGEDSLIKVPARVVGQANDFIKVGAETNCKTVRWIPIDFGLRIFPVDLLKDTRTAVVIASAPGSYRLLAYTALGDVPSEPHICEVVIVGPGPVPPNPTPPGPGPTPPHPPQPVDPFVNALQAAYMAETAADKAKTKADLLAIYKTVGPQIAGAANVTTWGMLFAKMEESAKVNGISGKLMSVQTAIQSELRKFLPDDTTKPLDEAGRKLAGEMFSYVAKALEAVK